MVSLHNPTPDESCNRRYRQLKELGDGHAALGEFGKARGYYRSACSLLPERAEAYVGLGALAIQQGQLDEACRAFEAARALEADNGAAIAGLAMVCQQRQDYAQAFDLYLKCLEIDSDNLVALLGLFQASRQMGTFSKIISYLELYLGKHSDDVSVLFCLATLYAREGKLLCARQAVLRVLQIEPYKSEASELLEQIQASLQAQVEAAL